MQGSTNVVEPWQVVIIMGTAGSGKSTIARGLADRVGPRGTYIDADDLHSEANRAKMQSGQPLSDEDRFPWLDDCVSALRTHTSNQPNVTVFLACSALKRTYRDHLRKSVDPNTHDLRFLYLKGSQTLLCNRVAARKEHFFKAELLKSQFEILEEPDPAMETDTIIVDVDGSPDEVVERSYRQLQLR
ncbi:thermoresistant gluconokinase [Phlyctochytrium arcticum]|nr:thermoresistant gluconokinase [Phlyctochytrium arcticum]